MEKKRLNLLLPTHLLKMHAKVCINLGISQTQAFTQYLLCVQEQYQMYDENASCVLIGFQLQKPEVEK